MITKEKHRIRCKTFVKGKSFVITGRRGCARAASVA